MLAACATRRGPEPVPPSPAVEGASPASLPGWAQEDHAAALAAYRQGCGAANQPAEKAACGRARSMANAGDPLLARRFFETNFRIEPVPGEGLLTAYFAPVYEARRAPGGEFSAPVRPRPGPVPYAEAASQYQPARAFIESQPAPDALAWMRPEDLFFLQIQGSGVLVMDDGTRAKAVFAATNGQPFVGIAKLMRERGLLPDNGTSQEAIRAWLANHRGAEADALMRENPRYVYFALAPDDGLEPKGAANIPLPVGRSIAVDPGAHAYGELFWIDAEAPVLTGAQARYRRLAVALDTGGAIRGEVRADLYLGTGEEAGREAGRVRHRLRMVRLVPVGENR
ncbi:MAG: MltA domain-containing protein [Caulobacteraceae bacterium]